MVGCTRPVLNIECDRNEFQCPEDIPFGYCISLNYRCDGYDDCRSGYDEQNCSTSENIIALE